MTFKSRADFTAEYFDYYAGWARIYEAGEIISSDDPNEHIYLHKIPLGVSVGICPWNFPVFVMARKLAPALVTGNTVVVKSSEVTPLTCARIAELWTASDDAALPPKGTYSVITGLGSTVGASAKSVGSRRWREVLTMSAQVGAALVSSPLVDIVSMTGSVATGKAIMKSAAEHMTKVSLELGGKAPAIVCADADLDLAVKGILASRICFSGQVCNCCERVYVHESIRDKFLNKLVAAMESVKVGAPADDGVDICGLVSSMQFDKVKGMVDRAVAGGAKVECGGDTLPVVKYGYQPTVLTNVKQSDEIVQEEIFGPVLPVMTFKTMDEAFDLACDTKFGLTSSIYTTNVDIAERAKNELRFGETYVNRENFEAIQGFHAGMRQSGIGGADGKHGLEEYLASHVVYVRRDPNAGN